MLPSKFLPAVLRSRGWILIVRFARRNPSVFFAVLQFLLLLAFFFPFLRGDLHFVYRDITSYFEPFARYISAAWAEGRFPMWNSQLYTGMPQIAVGHPHVLYPFTWLLAIPAFSKALSIYLILHLLITAVASFRLTQVFGYGHAAGALCGLAAAWNGYMLGMFSNFQLMSAMTWFPVLLLTIEHLNENRSLSNLLRFLAVSASVYLLIAAGSPEISVPAFALAWVWLGVRSWQAGPVGQWAVRLALRSAAMAAGLLFAAPLILPAMEWLSLSTRKDGMPPSIMLAWSTDWLNWISVLCTHPLGAEGDALSLFVRLTRGDDGHSYYLDSPYLSPIILILAIWGVFARGWRGKPLLLGLLLLFAILASGSNTPIGPILFAWLPMADVVRYPVKLVIFALAGLILLAVHGFDALLRRQFSNWALAAAALFATSCFAAGVVLSLDYARVWPWLRPSKMGGEEFPLKLVVYVNGLLAVHLYLAGILMLIFVCVLLLYKYHKITTRSFAVSVLTIVAGPLLLSAFVFERHGSSKPTFATPNVVAEYTRNPANHFNLGQQRFLVPLGHETFVVPDGVRKRFSNAVGSGSRYVAALGIHNTPLAYEIPSAHGYESAAINDYMVLMRQAGFRSNLTPLSPESPPPHDRALARFAAMTASKLLMESGTTAGSGPTLNQQLFHVVWKDEDLHARLYETSIIRPRWYLTTHVECLSQPNDFLKVLLDPEPSSFEGPSRPAYVLRHEAGISSDANCSPRAEIQPEALGSIELRFDRSEELEWKVQVEKPALFVVADQFYPGWIATVDGKPIALTRVNLVNRGIAVPAGQHIVRMSYQPTSFRKGLWLAVDSLLFVLLGWGVWAVQGRYRKSDKTVTTG